ncbi:MAG: rRNA maturation RNase YbeY [Deltaproteobacteria bacterium]|nr:rRNA maturation RNase YbeY [Deltaproteobacteria bacterium]
MTSLVEVTRRRRRKARGGDARRLAKVIEQTLELEGSEPREVSLLLTDDAEIQGLNAQYASKDRPTDVLAFAYDEGAGPRGPLGDIIVSVETAARQAMSRRVTLDRELELLVVHGALHLLGHDHSELEEARRMRSRTRSIRRALARRLPLAHVKVL